MEGVKDERHTEKDRKMYAGEPGPHDSRGPNNKDASYAVDPNTHRPTPSGPTEPAASPSAGDKMIGKDTGGQDHFPSKGM